jgi:hypothetical protein
MAELLPDLPTIQQHYRATAARLRRVNAALDRWSEREAAAAIPPELRALVQPPPPRPPRLRPAPLRDLQAILLGRLQELDELRRDLLAARRN